MTSQVTKSAQGNDMSEWTVSSFQAIMVVAVITLLSWSLLLLFFLTLQLGRDFLLVVPVHSLKWQMLISIPMK